MSKEYDVSTAVLRYIVPFTYSTFEAGGDPFESACSLVEKQEEAASGRKAAGPKKLWLRRTAALDGPESDLYAYIRDEFSFDDETTAPGDRNMGVSWLLRRSEMSNEKDGRKIKELQYFPGGISEKDRVLPAGRAVEVTNVGLYLFRNSLGFIWYELKLSGSGPDTAELKRFQNRIRELNLAESTWLWENCGIERPEAGIGYKEGTAPKKYLAPFSLAAWLMKLTAFLNIHWLAERKLAYQSMVDNSLKALKNLSAEIIKPEKTLAETVTPCAPDKAILYTYAVLYPKDDAPDTPENRAALSYHLTNGYTDRYHFHPKTASEMETPFDKVLWYATQEGASYLSWPGDDNAEVFTSSIRKRIQTDYLSLYIKVLYQSFSLLIYANKIQEEISAGRNNAGEERFTELFEEINRFLAKGMATSVSYIHHQSTFYIYLKERLRVHEDIKSVTAGLNALDMLQREHQKAAEDERLQKEENAQRLRDEKIQAIMSLLSFLAAGSAMLDIFVFITKLLPDAEEGWPWLWQQSKVLFWVEVLVSAAILFFTVYVIVRVKLLRKRTKQAEADIMIKAETGGRHGEEE